MMPRRSDDQVRLRTVPVAPPSVELNLGIDVDEAIAIALLFTDCQRVAPCSHCPHCVPPFR